MNRNQRIVLGAGLLAASVLGIALLFSGFLVAGQVSWHGFMGSMMGWQNQGVLEEVNGTVANVGWNEIEVQVNGKEVEMHGPSWFWEQIGVKVGDAIVAKGVFVSMMEHGTGWHEELVPFEITISGKTYGSVDKAIPIWMQ